MGIFRKKELSRQVDMSNLPRHVAVIMDGNGRWAQKRSLPRSAGHRAGAEVFRNIGAYCKKLGIDYLTVYAFSTENWKRPKEEVDTIMMLLKRYLLEAIETMERDNVRLHFMGDMSPLTDELKGLVEQCNAISARLSGCQCNICINYGGRAEITHAARDFARDCMEGKRNPEELTEDIFEQYLYSGGIPSPELLIRPGGEQRLSNFLLWQCAYAEFYYTNVLWPDFDKEELHKAIVAFQKRNRRFGGLK